MITPSLLVEMFKSVNQLMVYREDAVLFGLVWTVEIMHLCIMASHMSPLTNLEESYQSSGQLLHTVLQVVDTESCRDFQLYYRIL